MASIPSPVSLPDPSKSGKKQKQKIDIPYNRWPNRLRRAIKSFITIFIVTSIATTLYLFATSGDVELNLVMSALGGILQVLMYVMTALFGIIVQFGLLFWFLSRPKVEVITPGADTSVTFDDYWGQPQLVKLVKQWMSLLRDRKEFEKMGGKYISGLLLYGPPGTGKTMLAKAVAGESGMAFLSSAGTSFQGMFWGMDILKVLRFSAMARALARKYGACVAYIDEIDAIGMNRGGVRGGGGGMGGMASGTGMGMGMGMMALSTLLSQMDGINELTRGEKLTKRIYKLFGQDYKTKRNWHVMWMGSTNRPDVLDPALTRSGRLDTKIAVEAPDRASRRLIIQGYLKRIQHDDTIDIEAIVGDTNGTTPADISGAITKDSVRIAFFDGRKKVSQKDIDRAFLEQQSGMEMPIEEFDEGQRRVLAYHEAGHAIAQYYMMPDQKIIRTTIVRLSTGSFGHMAPVDTVEQHIRPIIHFAYDIIVCLAGRASEKIYSGQAYASVGGDYPAAAAMMERLAFYGFFGPPPILHGRAEEMGREKTFQKYWLAMEDATEKLMRKHWKEVTALAEELLLKHTMSGKEVNEIIEANQSAEMLNDDIIPKTLAAIRAQALAEIRNTNALPEPARMPAGATTGNIVITDEDVVVINGNTYAKVNPTNRSTSGQTASQPIAPVQINDNGPKTDGPTVINGGGYEPKLADDDK